MQRWHLSNNETQKQNFFNRIFHRCRFMRRRSQRQIQFRLLLKKASKINKNNINNNNRNRNRNKNKTRQDASHWIEKTRECSELLRIDRGRDEGVAVGVVQRRIYGWLVKLKLRPRPASAESACVFRGASEEREQHLSTELCGRRSRQVQCNAW